MASDTAGQVSVLRFHSLGVSMVPKIQYVLCLQMGRERMGKPLGKLASHCVPAKKLCLCNN